MGAMGGLMGFAGGVNGTGISGPEAANIQTPVSTQQATQANQQVTSLLAALQAQNGLANQSQVYNQFQGVANGTGPNPAQAMLAQSTGQNVQNQAALMAGQRGASSNIGLMARQAAQQGAAAQQNAIGQAASLQAQQSLGALGSAGNIATTQAQQQVGATQSNQQALLNAIAAQNNSQVGMQSNINQANASMANTQMSGQQAMIGGMMQGLGSAGGMMGGSGGAGGAAAAMAKGGEVRKKYAVGGITAQPDIDIPAPSLSPDQADSQPNQPQSMLGKFLNSAPMGQQLQGSQQTQPPTTDNSIGLTPNDPGAALLQKGAKTLGSSIQKSMMMGMATGGMVKAMLSPEEIYLSPKAVEQVRAGADPMHVGERIPGKPKVGGAKNSYANDTVKRTLKEGGIVVPRSATKSSNPDQASKSFVDSVLAKRKARSAA